MTTLLRDELLKRSISASSLVEIGIDQSRANQLLLGEEPTIAEVRKIGTAFKIPIRSLIVGLDREVQGQFRLRQNFQSGGEKDDEIVDLLSRAETLSELLPDAGADNASVEIQTSEKTLGAAEDLAAFSRVELLNTDLFMPLIDLETRVASFTGANVIISKQRRIEGGVIARNEKVFIFLSPRPDPRMRFTLAHEFCHYLVDFSFGESGGWFDEDVFSETKENRIDEMFANGFASALLLPRAAVGEALNGFRENNKSLGKPVSDYEVMFLAIFFGVSFQVAARRLEDLDLISRGAGQSLYENIRRNFGSPEKFAEKLNLPPRPTYDWGIGSRLLLQRIKKAFDEEKLSIGRLSELLEISIDDISRIVARDANLH